MTIVVSVRVTDGIVLASDSATSFVDGDGIVVKVYNNANKIFNLVKGKPIGAMTYGNGSIGTASIATLSKDFRVLLGDSKSNFYLDPGTYTLEDVAEKAKQFLFTDSYLREYPKGSPNYAMGYRICGYSATGSLPEAWEIFIANDQCSGPTQLYEKDSFGIRWAGESEALDRLILGAGSKAYEAFVQAGLDETAAKDAHSELINHLYAPLYLPAMPIQDAIDLARFLADTAAKFAQFSHRAATVGGPIEIATITKHEGFKWVSRKHYYSTDFNAGVTDHVA